MVCIVPPTDDVSMIQSNRKERVVKQGMCLAQLVQQLLKGGLAAVYQTRHCV